MTREVDIEVERESVVGAWRVKCPTCPLLPHFEALGAPPTGCASGIQTNVQGALPLFACKFYILDTARQESGKFVVECTYGEEKP